MEYMTLAGILMIVGFSLVVVASLVGPNEVYSAPDNERTLKIIEQKQRRWVATNLIWAVGSLVTAAGFLFLTLALEESHSPWLLFPGALAFIVGAIAWAIFLSQRTIDPAGYLYTTPPALFSLLFAWAKIAALALFGVAFLLGNFPNWLGYILLLSTSTLLLGLIFYFEVFYRSFPPQFVYVLTLIVGIVAIQQ
jgi:hypothetical protein